MSRPSVVLAAALTLGGLARLAGAQIYGYTDDKGVLILSNVPTHDGMRLIVDGTAEEAGKTWRYTGQYDPHIMESSRLYGVDASLVRAVIAVESGFNRYARSHKGAQGLMQLMPETARRYGVMNPYDPRQNIRAGTRHLRSLLEEFDDVHLALAAYNAGATPVRRYGTIPPYPETRNYVRKVMALYRAGSKIEIIKGDRVYSITRPGGQTRVTVHQGTESAPSNGGAPTLADIARRVAAERAPVPVRLAEARAPSPPSPSAAEPPQTRRVYYRYTDPEGIVVITPRRPASYPYDVLLP